ncbi:MAG: hypothetical protein M1504_03400 [Candidatus Marsarchaeota archaeon]|nr:hypothetical protein [Candidatus Marsarchaeota archaeon]
MDLLARVGIIVIVIVVMVAGASLLISQHQQSPLTENQAVQLVLNDVKTANPSAIVYAVSVSNSTVKSNSWDIIFAVIYNATRPCPSLFTEEYDYPATGLQPLVTNWYTRSCVIYGLSNVSSYIKSYVISSPEIAIVRSYTSNNPEVQYYVNTYGYNSVNVHAAFFSNISVSMTPLNTSFGNSWLVNYSAPNANYNQYVVLDQSGTVLGNYTIQT